jgi:Gpi18-like mannosyltransferase
MDLSDITSGSAPLVEQGSAHMLSNKREQKTAESKDTQSPETENKWWTAFQEILPIYIATHIAAFVTTCLSVLFIHKDFDWSSSPLSTLWQAWNRWDTGHFTSIATQGYVNALKTAFFPLYPLLMRALMIATHNNALIAGLLISDISGLIALLVLYQLVREDFDQERALRTVLYLSLFPTAFFLMAAYNEALFLCFSLLSFYYMRHSKWWLAGLFGFCASLTRSAGLFLLVPFAYEYLYQRQFQFMKIRWNVISGALIPAGIAVFAAYCYVRFGDPLAFSHVQVYWQRHLALPWHGIVSSISIIQHSSGFLSFDALRNLLDLLPDLFILALIILSFVGPWRLLRTHWSYNLYAAVLYLFCMLVPASDATLFPLQSTARFMLEIFPAFIMLANMGKARMLHLNYLLIAGSIGFFLLTQFLTGHWIV